MHKHHSPLAADSGALPGAAPEAVAVVAAPPVSGLHSCVSVTPSLGSMSTLAHLRSKCTTESDASTRRAATTWEVAARQLSAQCRARCCGSLANTRAHAHTEAHAPTRPPPHLQQHG
jgi:hypothetical protein